MKDYDVLILGGGIAGLSTAYHLARRDVSRSPRILLVERERTLGSRSSAENAAILRTFGPDPLINAMGRASAGFLREPGPGFAPFPLVDERGLLLLASGDVARTLRARAEADGLSSDELAELDAAQRAELAPHLREASDAGLFFAGDGRIDVSAEIDGFARGARAGGVEIRTGCGAQELELADGGRRVAGARLADGSRVSARRTVLAAGGWAGRLGAAAGSEVSLRPTRRHLLVTAADARVDPDWPVVWIEDEGFYCRPESGGLLISACDLMDADPDRYANDPDALEWIATKTARFLPDFADAGAAHLWCGLRTLTEDDRFAIGFDPTLEGLYWVAGLGGHGMTCGPEIGRLAATGLSERAPAAQDAAALEAFAPGRLRPEATASHAAQAAGQSIGA